MEPASNWPPARRRWSPLGAVALLAYSARLACFGTFDFGWAACSAILLSLTFVSPRRPRFRRVSEVLLALAIAGNVGGLAFDFYRYGGVLLCPPGTRRSSDSNIAGYWVGCRTPDGSPLGPTMGTTVWGDGSQTDYYVEYRSVSGRVVGLEVRCGQPMEPFEVCYPETGSCYPARFTPPLDPSSCSNLSGLVDAGFLRKCETPGSPNGTCF